jgi:hypothetical protein
MTESVKRYPEDYEGVIGTWPQDGFTVTTLRTVEPFLRHLNGYVRFPKRPVRERGYDGLLAYVPVHGGITYAKAEPHQYPESRSMVYGFDCAHAGDEARECCQDPEWVREEAIRMGKAILLAKKYERRYLRNTTNKGKAKVIDEYLAECREAGLESSTVWSFGAMLNILGGEL